jgi:uncharacterized OB-fold protein
MKRYCKDCSERQDWSEIEDDGSITSWSECSKTDDIVGEHDFCGPCGIGECANCHTDCEQSIKV